MKEYTHLVDMRISAQFNELNSQEYKEEISLFGAVGAKFF